MLFFRDTVYSFKEDYSLKRSTNNRTLSINIFSPSTYIINIYGEENQNIKRKYICNLNSICRICVKKTPISLIFLSI